jgi:hypothetical protein
LPKKERWRERDTHLLVGSRVQMAAAFCMQTLVIQWHHQQQLTQLLQT